MHIECWLCSHLYVIFYGPKRNIKMCIWLASIVQKLGKDHVSYRRIWRGSTRRRHKEWNLTMTHGEPKRKGNRWKLHSLHWENWKDNGVLTQIKKQRQKRCRVEGRMCEEGRWSYSPLAMWVVELKRQHSAYRTNMKWSSQWRWHGTHENKHCPLSDRKGYGHAQVKKRKQVDSISMSCLEIKIIPILGPPQKWISKPSQSKTKQQRHLKLGRETPSQLTSLSITQTPLREGFQNFSLSKIQPVN